MRIVHPTTYFLDSYRERSCTSEHLPVPLIVEVVPPRLRLLLLLELVRRRGGRRRRRRLVAVVALRRAVGAVGASREALDARDDRLGVRLALAVLEPLGRGERQRVDGLDGQEQLCAGTGTPKFE